jgi:hypothetical protein
LEAVTIISNILLEQTGKTLRTPENCIFNFTHNSEFLVTDPEIPGSIPGATRFSEK